MNIKKMIEKTVSVDKYLCSVDGVPVFDLMQLIHVDNGHGQKLERWGASGVVFYTEDENVIAKLEEIKNKGNIEEIKQFLLENKEYCKDLYELKNNGLKLMDDKAFKAFNHLRNAEFRKDTLKNGYYGSAHLLVGDEMFIFYQNNFAVREYFSKDLNNSINYNQAQAHLLKQYKEKKIEPDTKLIGGAKDKVIDALLDINFLHLTSYQKETILIFKEFNDNVLQGQKLFTSLENNEHIAYFKQDSKNKIEVIIPKTKDDDFLVREPDGKLTPYILSNLLTHLNQKISQNRVNDFINTNKIKNK